MLEQWISVLNGFCQDQSIDLKIREKKAKEIGNMTHDIGGIELMVQVCQQLRKVQSTVGAATLINHFWDGIGTWRS